MFLSSSKFVLLFSLGLSSSCYGLGVEDEVAATELGETKMLRGDGSDRELQIIPPPQGSGVLAGLRPVNPQTDQPGGIYNGYSPSFGGYVVYDNEDDIRSKNTNIEAVVSNTTNAASIGSVKFELCKFLGGAPCLTIIENTYPYALCRNNGTDFFPCTNYSDMIRDYPSINATAYSGKNGTGSVIGSTATIRFIIYRMTDPDLFLWIVDAKLDRRLIRLDPLDAYTGGVGYQPLKSFNLSLAYWGPSFELNMELGWARPQYGFQAWWIPTGMICNYNNGTSILNETTAPFACFGNNGTDYYSFLPGLGEHKFEVYAYRQWGGIRKFFMLNVVP